MRTIAAFLFLALWAAAAEAQSVEARGGNLFYRPSCGAAARPLTTSGHDSDPELSPDGRRVVFLRAGPGGEASIWTIETGGAGLRRWIVARADTAPERTLADLQTPRFSPDGSRIYFLSSAWATSGAVHALDLASGAERFLIPGNSLEVMRSGEYAGPLLVEQHRYYLAGGSYDWLWLFTADGREVGPVGESEEAEAEFRSLYAPSAPACEQRGESAPHLQRGNPS